MSAYFSRNLFHILKYFLKRKVRRTVNVGLFHFNFPIKNIFIVFILVSRLFKTNGKCRLLLRKRNFECLGEFSKAKISPSLFSENSILVKTTVSIKINFDGQTNGKCRPFHRNNLKYAFRASEFLIFVGLSITLCCTHFLVFYIEIFAKTSQYDGSIYEKQQMNYYFSSSIKTKEKTNFEAN